MSKFGGRSLNSASFVIVGYQDAKTGLVSMVSLSNVCDVSIDEGYGKDELHSWGQSQPYKIVRRGNVTLSAEARSEGVVRVVADDHASAWRKLFDLWVPPSGFGADAENAISAHYLFNPPEGQANNVPPWAARVGGGGGGGAGMVWTDRPR